MSPPSDPVRDEQRLQMRFTLFLGAIAFASVVIAGVLFADQYAHPMPESDCSRPFDYPLCERAHIPANDPAPSIAWVFLGTIGTVVLAIILLWIGYHASVIRQTEIVSSVAGSVQSVQHSATSLSVSSSPSAPDASVSTLAPASTQTSASKATAQAQSLPQTKAIVTSSKQGVGSPQAIPNNAIAPSMIAPPKAIPKKGVAANVIPAAEKK